LEYRFKKSELEIFKKLDRIDKTRQDKKRPDILREDIRRDRGKKIKDFITRFLRW